MVHVMHVLFFKFLQSTFDVQSHFTRIKLDLIKAIQNPALLIYELFFTLLARKEVILTTLVSFFFSN